MAHNKTVGNLRRSEMIFEAWVKEIKADMLLREAFNVEPRPGYAKQAEVFSELIDSLRDARQIIEHLPAE